MDSHGKGFLIAVVGSGDDNLDESVLRIAEDLGKEIAINGSILITGGLGGIMESASKGAYESGGITIGILPGKDKSAANRYVLYKIATGLSEARNMIIATAADALISIGGSYGTISEVAIGLKLGKPVVSIGSMKGYVEGVVKTGGAIESYSKVIEILSR